MERTKPLKTRDLILSLSKDEAKISCFFSSLLVEPGDDHAPDGGWVVKWGGRPMRHSFQKRGRSDAVAGFFSENCTGNYSVFRRLVAHTTSQEPK